MRIQINLVTFFAIAIGIYSCAPSNENMTKRSPDNEALVKKYLDAVIAGDTASIEGFLADSFISYGPKISDSADRAQTVADYKTNWRSRWKSVEFSRYTMLSATIEGEGSTAGDWVLDWGRVTVNSKDNTPTFTFNWHGAFKVKDGKIVEEVGFYNEADIQAQIGFTLVPPGDSTATAKSK